MTKSERKLRGRKKEKRKKKRDEGKIETMSTKLVSIRRVTSVPNSTNSPYAMKIIVCQAKKDVFDEFQKN